MRSDGVRILLQARTLAMAAAIAFLLVWLSPDARGETTSPKVDVSRQGDLYAAGELLVTYESDVSGQDADRVVEQAKARVDEEISTSDAQLLSFPEVKNEHAANVREQRLRRAKEALERDPDVKHVDYNYLRMATLVPNDPAYVNELQWNLDIIGAPAAWEETLGEGARVAVVDTGIAGHHPDLESKIVAQKDVINNDDVAQDDSRGESEGHGTHVAGTVGAVTNNGEGVAAVCPSCRLLVAKSGDSNGLFFDSDIVQGIYWSVQNRAKAINLSLGARAESRILEHAVNYAWDHDVVVVAAAGNHNPSNPNDPKKTNYPAAYKNVISVAATNQSDKKAVFSNFGKIDVAAPGVDILSTVPGGGYDTKQGTSMASPHVAALAGLLASQGRSAPEIRNRIQRTAYDLGAEGKDKYFGWGRIDASKAVSR